MGKGESENITKTISLDIEIWFLLSEIRKAWGKPPISESIKRCIQFQYSAMYSKTDNQ